jgi:DNA-directed RNA polymerase-3 subunit RPC5
VVAEYDIYITSSSNPLYLLQYPNRKSSKPYTSAQSSSPSELRIKPKSGFIELDIPRQTDPLFDKVKGITWGDSMRLANESKTNAFGLAAGFGKGVRTNEIFAQDRSVNQPLSEDKIPAMLNST